MKDKWDNAVGDVYEGAEITEIVGNNQEASINVSLSASGTYTDPVGRIKEGITVPANDPRVASWPSQPTQDAGVTPESCDFSTQNITVIVAGFTLSPAISRSVDLCRATGGSYMLQITWP